MACDMKLRDAISRNAVDVLHGSEAVILRGNIDIVHIDKNPIVSRMNYPDLDWQMISFAFRLIQGIDIDLIYIAAASRACD